MSSGSHHVISLKTNITVFIGLLILTVVTVAIAKVDLGSEALNVIVALAIATVKATLVFMWFMHLRYDSWVNRIIFAGAIGFVLIFYVITVTDVFFR